jgi:hypothetical protein
VPLPGHRSIWWIFLIADFRWLALLSFLSIPAVLWMKRVSAKGTVAVH